MNDLLVCERLATATQGNTLVLTWENVLPPFSGGQVVVQSGGAKARNVLGTGYLMENRDYPSNDVVNLLRPSNIECRPLQ